jgi:tRNA (guanine10-N2)-dimethyltransferase
VVSDLPYGQSVTIIGSGLSGLYQQALLEIKRVVKEGNRSVLVTHQDIRQLAGQYFDIIGYYEQRVHKSLTRRILVIK